MQENVKRDGDNAARDLVDPLEIQHGGTHYKGLAIQPIEYGQKNQLGACEYSVVKYVTRYRSKGRADDLKKAIHFLQILLKLEYGVICDVAYTQTEKDE